MKNIFRTIFFFLPQYLSKNASVFGFIFSIIFFPLLNSCSNDLPEGEAISTKIIYDFEKSSEKPIIKFSLFVKMKSDVRRVDYINLFHLESGYRWIIEEPILTKVNDDFYAGYTNCSSVISDDYNFPEGTYSVYYVDAKGEEYFTSFNLKYLDFPKSFSSDEFKNILNFEDKSIYIGMYSEDNSLVYYDKVMQNLEIDIFSGNYNLEEIFKLNNSAHYFRIFYDFDKVVYILPKVYKK